MYNSVIGYAYKLIKGNIFFSSIMFLAISQLMVINSIFSLVWKYEILLNDNIPFFREFSIYSLFVFILISSLLLSIMSSIYIFSKNGRMFSILRIFGSTKLSIRKLYTVLSLLYPLMSMIIAFIEIAVLYIRYRVYILSIVERGEIFSGVFIILCANVVIVLIYMAGAFVINSFLLNRDPYEDLRGTL